MTLNVSNLYLISFKDVKGIGIKKLRDIYNKFGDFQKAFNASLDEYKEIIKDQTTLHNISEFLNIKDFLKQKIKI